MNHTLLYSSIGIFHFIILFAIYSFIGWIIEVIYRTYTQRKFINAGFLYGYFLPIYGFGAVFVTGLEYLLDPLHPLLKLFIYGVVLSAVEYSVGFLFERIFRLKLWDYSQNKFNLHGRICLLFSCFWAAMAFIFFTFINPVIVRFVASLDMMLVRGASVVFMVYMTTDFIFSVASLTSFRNKVAYLYSEYFNLSNAEAEKIFKSIQRLRNAFPNLNKYIEKKINTEIRAKVNTFMKTIQNKIIMDLEGRRPFEREFNSLIQDIYMHEEFMKLKQYYHHNSSIYAHVRDVAYFSYRLCRYLKLDYRSATRGALLHDFFLYDWRKHNEPDLAREKYHGIEHPRIALDNARKYFELNEIEKDIILKHMWPLTIVPPKYKESFIVSFADKYLSSREFVDELKKRRKQVLRRRPRLKRRASSSESD
jgi:uncharacterized membrane protein/HD superfamily phosphodiesterase